MSAGEIIFMVLVVGVAISMAVLKSKVPYWLGFILMLVASAAAIVGGVATKGYKIVPFGVACLLGTIVAWVSGATSKPATSDDAGGDGDSDRDRDKPDTLGGLASRIRWYAWLIIAALVVGGVAISFALPA